MSDLIPFSFDGHSLRVVVRDGDPWFVAADACRVLDIADVRQALDRLDDDERGLCPVPTPGGTQEVRCVSESGLYLLVLGSRKPEARAFKRWITREVIPSIRKTGSYGSDPIALLGDPSVLRTLLGNYAERVQRLEADVADRETRIAADAPKVEVFDRIVASGDTEGFRAAAKLVHEATGANEAEFRSLMIQRKWVQRLDGRLMPAHVGIDRKYVTTREREWSDIEGGQHVKAELRITQKGITKAIEILLSDGAAA